MEGRGAYISWRAGVHIQIMGNLSPKPPTLVTRGALYHGHTLLFLQTYHITNVKHTISQMLIAAKYSIQPTRECVGFTVARGALYHGHTHTKLYHNTVQYNIQYTQYYTLKHTILLMLIGVQYCIQPSR